jgi:Type VI secretion system spike protein VgrG3-like, C-terminal
MATSTGSTPQALPPLGALSARFESNGNPGSIGHDSTGGFSYGTYQIATLTGTFSDFMNFLRAQYPDLAQPLDAAGGPTAATNGTQQFQAAWKSEAQQNPSRFQQAQHDYIQATHYDVQVAKLQTNFGLDVNQRSRALQNVVWSMAVQMGNTTQTIFRNALKNVSSIDTVDDAQLIPLLYAEREKVNIYFASSTPAVKAAVLKRFQQEQNDALQMLQAESASGSN